MAKMKPELTRKAIGGLAVLAGVWWLCSAVYPLARRLSLNGVDGFDVGFLLVPLLLMPIPGLLLVVSGANLFRKMSPSSLKWIVGVFCVFIAFYLARYLAAAFPVLLPVRLRESTLLFISNFFAIPAYILVVRWLLRHLTNEAPPCHALLSRWVLMVMAWQLMLGMTETFREFSPTKEGYPNVPQEPWGILGLVVPIVIAYGAYRIVAAKLDHAQHSAAGGNAASPGNPQTGPTD